MYREPRPMIVARRRRARRRRSECDDWGITRGVRSLTKDFVEGFVGAQRLPPTLRGR